MFPALLKTFKEGLAARNNTGAKSPATSRENAFAIPGG
jgi:hypothetical protein